MFEGWMFLVTEIWLLLLLAGLLGLFCGWIIWGSGKKIGRLTLMMARLRAKPRLLWSPNPCRMCPPYRGASI